MYAMLVKDCKIDNGQGKEVVMVDGGGCTTDPVTLANITYDASLRKATAVSPSHFLLLLSHRP